MNNIACMFHFIEPLSVTGSRECGRHCGKTWECSLTQEGWVFSLSSLASYSNIYGDGMSGSNGTAFSRLGSAAV